MRTVRYAAGRVVTGRAVKGLLYAPGAASQPPLPGPRCQVLCRAQRCPDAGEPGNRSFDHYFGTVRAFAASRPSPGLHTVAAPRAAARVLDHAELGFGWRMHAEWPHTAGISQRRVHVRPTFRFTMANAYDGRGRAEG